MVRKGDKKHSLGYRILQAIPVNVWIALFVILLALVAAAVLINKAGDVADVSVSEIAHNTLTPTQIKSIENIGEWEFLAVSDEEIVDTVDRGFFGDSELIRIYYGTLRLGLDMREVTPVWLRFDGDTLRAELPPIKLLSDDFIDEARTRTFFESGTWTPADRKQLYLKAQRAMRNRVMTAENMEKARQAARAQMDKLLRAMGFEHVSISFAPSSEPKPKR